MTNTTRERFENLVKKLYPEICMVKNWFLENEWKYKEPDSLWSFIETIEKEAVERWIKQGREEVKARVQLFVDKRYWPSGNWFEIWYNHAVDLIANSISSLK